MNQPVPPATVPLADPQHADPQVKAVFQDIMQVKQIDFVPHFWRVLAANPALLEQVWNQLKTWMHPEAVGRTPLLDAQTREIIALAVSATNGCSYCVNSHTAALKKQGASDELLGEVLAIAGLFNMTNSLADGFQVEPDVRPPV